MAQADDAPRTWTRRTLLGEGIRRLEAAGIEEARRNAEWMLCEVLACSRVQLYAYGEEPVVPAQVEAFEAMLVRRARHEPLQYILGHTVFFGLRLRVTPAVLIPRPETEQVVEAALGLILERTAPRILDVGTGSGCIALALKHNRRDAEVAACDVSPDALALALDNATALELPISFFHADALAPGFPAYVPHSLDLLISNPPYIPLPEATTLAPEVHAHEPALALFSGDDPLLFYRALTRSAPALLASGGYLVFETHADYAPTVAALLEEAGFKMVTVKADLAGHPRIVSGRMFEERGAKGEERKENVSS